MFWILLPRTGTRLDETFCHFPSGSETCLSYWLKFLCMSSAGIWFLTVLLLLMQVYEDLPLDTHQASAVGELVSGCKYACRLECRFSLVSDTEGYIIRAAKTTWYVPTVRKSCLDFFSHISFSGVGLLLLMWVSLHVIMCRLSWRSCCQRKRAAQKNRSCVIIWEFILHVFAGMQDHSDRCSGATWLVFEQSKIMLHT